MRIPVTISSNSVQLSVFAQSTSSVIKTAAQKLAFSTRSSSMKQPLILIQFLHMTHQANVSCIGVVSNKYATFTIGEHLKWVFNSITIALVCERHRHHIEEVSVIFSRM